MNIKIKSFSVVVGLVACAFVNAAEFEAAVWRGETAYVEIPKELQAKVWSVSENSARGDVSLELISVDEVKYDLINPIEKNVIIGKGSVPDVCRPWKKGEKPALVKVVAKPDAKPGKRIFDFGEAGKFELRVVNRVLPPAKDWKYFLDLWQHPWAVSRYFKVKPFSKEHYAKMEPIYRELAECGCKALTVTLLDLPWNHQCYDGYYTMIDRVKKADGTWVFDYTIFDEYVEFGRKCGLGPDIACYSMCPWRYMMTWKDESGKSYREKILPGTPEFEDYWGPFLVDFAKHLKEKGWFNDAYIAMDERGPEDVRMIVKLIQAKAPGLKVSACGKTKPSLFADIQIENFCLGFVHLRDNFLPELQPRREKGFVTTFYVCGSAKTPNTFMFSHSAEGFYLGAYPVMIGFDGFLRWAANSWPKDPYKDASYKTEKSWVNGDVYMIYPNGELSPRLIALRAGVIAAEKMNILKKEGMQKSGFSAEDTIKTLAAPHYYRDAIRGFGKQKPCKVDFVKFRRNVEEFVNSDPGSASTEASDKVWLDEIKGKDITSGWQQARDCRSVGGNKLRIGSRTFERGVGTHAASVANFQMDGNALAFEADVGVDSEVGAGNGSVKFTVALGGRVVFESPVMKSGDEPLHIKVNLAGADLVTLRAEDAGDGKKKDHANWANAFFVMRPGCVPKTGLAE